jgi:hypothetical protein
MADYSEVFVGIDTSKLRNAVAVAEGGRNGEVRYHGEIENTETATTRVSELAHRRLQASPPPLHDQSLSRTPAKIAGWRYLALKTLDEGHQSDMRGLFRGVASLTRGTRPGRLAQDARLD